MHKLIRITTIPLSLEKLLEGQLTYMSNFYEVTAVSADKNRLEKYGRDNGVKTYWVEMTRAITPLQDLTAVLKLYRFFRNEKPLIVHTHTPKAGIVGMLAARLAGVPVRLHTVAGLPLLETTGIKRNILDIVEKLTYKLATRIYPNSTGLKEIILNLGFTTQDKMRILGSGSSNGIDISYFNPGEYSYQMRKSLKADLKIPEDDVVFIFIGRLVSEKGINELIDAFKKLQQIHNDTSLLLVGPLEEDLDPLKPETRREIELNEKIFTTGYQQDVRPYLSVADVLAFPSYREGFPNVVMQAGAMGIPSIVSNINGCNEIIENNQNGIIIPVKDEIALFNAMNSLVDDKEKRKNLSLRARDIICSRYDRFEYWDLLKKEYDSLEMELKKP